MERRGIKDFKGYKINTWYIHAWAGLSFLFVLLLIIKYGVFWAAVTCPESPTPGGWGQPCANPFYNNCPSKAYKNTGVCDKEFILPGESVGTFPPPVVARSGLIVALFLLCMALMNHLNHNTGGRRPPQKTKVYI